MTPSIERYSTIILNRNHIEQDANGYYNRMVYNFGKSTTINENSSITWSEGALYYSWPNVAASAGNNTLAYTWIDGTTVNITLPDGLYQVTDIDEYVKFIMTNNGHYVIEKDSSGTFIGNEFFFQLTANAVLLKVTLTLTPVPTSGTITGSTDTLSIPSGATWSWPTTATTPQFIVNSSTFGELIGFATGTFPASALSTVYQINSTVTPEIEPQSSVLVTCSLVNNVGMSSPDMLDVFYAFSPTESPGAKIDLNSRERMWYPILPREYNSFEIRFYDQNRNPLRLTDPAVLIILTIRQQWALPAQLRY